MSTHGKDPQRRAVSPEGTKVRQSDSIGLHGELPCGAGDPAKSSGLRALGAYLSDGLGEHLGRLSTRYPVLAVDDEERHTGDAVGGSLREIGVHRVGVGTRTQRVFDGVAVETDLCREVGELGDATDVLAFGEVRGEESLGHIRLPANAFRIVQ